MPGHGVGELARRHRVGDRRDRLLGDVAVELGVALELLGHGAAQRLDRGRRPSRSRGSPAPRPRNRPRSRRKRGDPHPQLALDQHLHGAVGQLQQLQHVGEHADAVDALGLRLVLGGVLLAGQQDLLVVLHHRLERAHALLAADEERHDHVREHHDVAQRKDGIGRTAQFCHGLVLVWQSARSRTPAAGRSLRSEMARTAVAFQVAAILRGGGCAVASRRRAFTFTAPVTRLTARAPELAPSEPRPVRLARQRRG